MKTKDQRSIREIIIDSALLYSIVILVAIGIFAAIVRAVFVVKGGLAYDHFRQLLPVEMVQVAIEFESWFATYPVLTLLHVIPGGIFLFLAPLQLSARIRTRYITFHRWSGRLALLSALLSGLSGLLLGALFPYGGPVAATAVYIFGTLYLVAAIRAFIAIRNRDMTLHQEWMIRMVSIGIGISTIRVIGLILLTFTQVNIEELLGGAFWAGWTLTFVVAELWIRHTRTRRLAMRHTSVKAFQG
ncbi:MAG: DUF2306 domain-containing protein [Acidobacteriota bacterium]